jgi:hypothetical protein
MQDTQSRVYVVPVVREKPPPAPPPQNQRDLVRASLLMRPSLGQSPRR